MVLAERNVRKCSRSQAAVESLSDPPGGPCRPPTDWIHYGRCPSPREANRRLAGNFRPPSSDHIDTRIPWPFDLDHDGFTTNPNVADQSFGDQSDRPQTGS